MYIYTYQYNFGADDEAEALLRVEGLHDALHAAEDPGRRGHLTLSWLLLLVLPS